MIHQKRYDANRIISGLLLGFFLVIFLCNIRCEAFCPAKCVCNDNQLTADCTNGSLDLVPITLNPQLKQLRLNYNQIKSIKETFNFYTNLQELYIANNQLTTVGIKNFIYLKNLLSLNVQHNQIYYVNNQSFVGLNGLLQLNLAFNQLRIVKNRVFTGLNKLLSLNLAANYINAIDAEAFAGLISLQILHLNNNWLSQVPSSSFYHLPSLLQLDLSFNKLKTVGEFAFSQLITLEHLLLNQCELSHLSRSSFHGLSKLKHLQLSFNKLQHIPSESFSALSNLQTLQLQGTSLLEINENAFQALPNLIWIKLGFDDKLKSIDSKAFAKNVKLQATIIEHCKNLRYLPEKLFTYQNDLFAISLAHNSLQSLSQWTFKSDSLEWLRLVGNPLHCDCSIHWLFELHNKLSAKIAKERIKLLFEQKDIVDLIVLSLFNQTITNSSLPEQKTVNTYKPYSSEQQSIAEQKTDQDKLDKFNFKSDQTSEFNDNEPVRNSIEKRSEQVVEDEFNYLTNKPSRPVRLAVYSDELSDQPVCTGPDHVAGQILYNIQSDAMKCESSVQTENSEQLTGGLSGLIMVAIIILVLIISVFMFMCLVCVCKHHFQQKHSETINSWILNPSMAPFHNFPHSLERSGDFISSNSKSPNSGLTNKFGPLPEKPIFDSTNFTPTSAVSFTANGTIGPKPRNTYTKIANLTGNQAFPNEYQPVHEEGHYEQVNYNDEKRAEVNASIQNLNQISQFRSDQIYEDPLDQSQTALFRYQQLVSGRKPIAHQSNSIGNNCILQNSSYGQFILNANLKNLTDYGSMNSVDLLKTNNSQSKNQFMFLTSRRNADLAHV